MSDTNKLVAAILTAARLHGLSAGSGDRGSDDWLAEYEMWVDTLDKRDVGRQKASDEAWTRDMASALKAESER